MKKNLIIFILIFFSIVILASGVYIISDKAYPIGYLKRSGEIFVRATDLKPLGIDWSGEPSKGVFYLFYKDHIFILRSSGRVEEDFIDVLDENGTIFQGSNVYIKGSIIGAIVGKKWKKLAGGGYALFMEKRVIISYELSDGKLVINFNGEVVPEMAFLTKRSTGGYSLVISPIYDTVQLPKNLDGGFSGDALIINVNPAEGFVPKYHIDGNKVILIYGVVEKEFFGSYRIYNGLVWRRVKESFNGKVYIVDYLDIDLDWIDVIPESPKNGIGTLETVSSMVTRTGALAGVNANYFDPKSGMVIGLLVKGGTPLSTPYGGRPIFIINDEDEAFIERIYVEVQLKLADVLFLVKGINTINKGEVKIYTKEYGKNVEPEKDKLYFVAKGGIIVKKGFKHPLGYGELLIELSKKFEKFLENVDLGSPARLILNASFDTGIKHAIEGGPLLLYKGQPIKESNSEKARYGGGIPFAKAPRTIVAMKDRKHISLIIIEQNGKHPGMNYDEMVKFLMNKGYISAMCFDGGSSTSLAIHGKTVNFTKTGRKPYVAAGLLLYPKKK